MTEQRALGNLLLEWELPIKRCMNARLLAVDENRLLLANDEPGCYLLDVEQQTCIAQPWKRPDWASRHDVSPYPYSLSVSRSTEHSRRVAAAGGGAFFVHWDLDNGQEKIVETESAVQSVSVSHDGSLIACGLGQYPLGPSDVQAQVELRNPFNGSLVKQRTLLGVATSAVQWLDGNEDRVYHPDANPGNGEVIVATTCMRSQDRGHLWLLDAANLSILEVLDLDYGPLHETLRVWPDEGWIETGRSKKKAIDAFDLHGGEEYDTDDLGGTLCTSARLQKAELPAGRVAVLVPGDSGAVVLKLHECLR
ncbi:hypothetical protein [Synechococcus sp. 1G10]|uniref:hypothetical protein n=1 Tax=Synechococcus sp. 1G10 TaxID=2025605 RepID=UPI00117D96F4|nr:hypothetical protein [Synechococcus sp. 1G10]